MTKFHCRDMVLADIDMILKFWPQNVGDIYNESKETNT